MFLGLGLFFFTSAVTFADSNEDMIAKQAEIDKYIFEDHAQELEAKGISVTHTAPLETTVEIGILPYTQETIDYFNELFGEEALTIVDGQMAVTFAVESEPLPVNGPKKQQKKKPAHSPILFIY